jgi:pyruvate-ferredoxin/flavodoxin oxidoreductase
MVRSGLWTLYRFDPRRAAAGASPLLLDSPPPTASIRELMKSESRYGALDAVDHERFERLASMAEESVARRSALYRHLAELRPVAPEVR